MDTLLSRIILLAEYVANSIQNTLLFLWLHWDDFFRLIFWKSLKGQLVAKLQFFLHFTKLWVSPAYRLFQLVNISVQTSRNSCIQLLLGNSRQHTTIGITLGQGSRSFITLETSTRIPNLTIKTGTKMERNMQGIQY